MPPTNHFTMLLLSNSFVSNQYNIHNCCPPTIDARQYEVSELYLLCYKVNSTARLNADMGLWASIRTCIYTILKLSCVALAILHIERDKYSIIIQRAHYLH